MLKQVTITLDTSDPLQAQVLVEYLAASDRTRFGRTCLMLGYLAATGRIPAPAAASNEPVPVAVAPTPRKGKVIGAKLFGVE